MDDWIAEEGYPGRGGVTYVRHLDAYNFAVYSKHATAVAPHFYRPDDVAVPTFWWESLTFEIQGEGE